MGSPDKHTNSKNHVLFKYVSETKITSALWMPSLILETENNFRIFGIAVA